jgi:hypothetical protein
MIRLDCCSFDYECIPLKGLKLAPPISMIQSTLLIYFVVENTGINTHQIEVSELVYA